jgi:hypothetical protein
LTTAFATSSVVDRLVGTHTMPDRSLLIQEIKEARSATLLQDARGTRIAVFLWYADAAYNVKSCLLGWAKDAGGTAHALADTTVRVVKRFCTISPPGHDDCLFDEGLWKHLCSIIHGIDTDGAADEIKCGNLLQAEPFVNAIRRGREKSHSARGSAVPREVGPGVSWPGSLSSCVSSAIAVFF